MVITIRAHDENSIFASRPNISPNEPLLCKILFNFLITYIYGIEFTRSINVCANTEGINAQNVGVNP